MNILAVHNYYQQPGGEDGVFAEETAMLERHGHRVVRYTVHNDAVVQLGKARLAKKTIFNRAIYGELRALIRKEGVEVAHFHNTFPLISPAGYYAAKHEGAGVVQTLHNYRLLCPAATFYRDGHVCEDCLGKSVPWPGVLHRCYRGSLPASAMTAAMLTYHRAKRTWSQMVDVYVALTEFARAKFVEGGLPADRIVIKPNFVDPDPGAGPGGGNYALFVGRLSPEKGVIPLLEQWKVELPDVALKVVGDGPLRDSVVGICGDAGSIEYLGRKPSPEVLGIMGGADMLVFPSRWYEGMPRTIVESYAKGTPVLAASIGSMKEMIDPGRTGFLFDPDLPGDLAKHVRRILSDSDLRSKMRSGARQEYEMKFTASRNYPMMESVYQRARRSV